MPRGHVLPDGEKLALLRGEADLTQWQLSREAGYGLRTIGKLEDSRPTGAKTLSAVATVLSRRLNRPIQLADLIQRNGHDLLGESRPAEDDYLVEEAIKFLDLRHSCPQQRSGSAPGVANRAILWDEYRFRRLPPHHSELSFFYAGNGQCIRGQSLSHAPYAEWIDLNGRCLCREAECCPEQSYQLKIDVKTLSRNGRSSFRNQLEYVHCFDDPASEWFQTSVIYPTESLSLMLLFPAQKPCRAVRGRWKQHPTAPFLAAPDEPVCALDGILVYWRVRFPQVGGTYQLDWRW